MALRCTECNETEYHKEGCTIAEWVEMAQSSNVADRAFANLFSDLWRGAVVEVDE